MKGCSQKLQTNVSVSVTCSGTVVTLSRGRCVTTYPSTHRGGRVGDGELPRLLREADSQNFLPVPVAILRDITNLGNELGAVSHYGSKEGEPPVPAYCIARAESPHRSAAAADSDLSRRFARFQFER